MAGTGGTRRRRIVLAISLVLIAGIGYGVLRVALSATGKPTISVDYAAEYNEQARPANYDPNDDAAPGYKEAFALLPAIPNGLNPVAHLWEYDPASEEYKMLESWLTSCEPAIDLLHGAAAKPYFWGRVASGDPNLPLSLENFDFGMLTQASHCLRYHAEYLAARGNPAEASRCIATGLRMAGHLNNAGRESLVPGQIVEMIVQRAAFDLLARTDVDAALLADMQRHLEEVLAARATPSFRSHAILLRDVIQKSFTDNGRNDGHVLFHAIRDNFEDRKVPKSELGANLAYLRHFWIAWSHPSRRETIQTVDRLTEAADQFIKQTPWELHTRGVDLSKRLREVCGWNPFLQIAGAETTLTWAIQAHYKNLASTEALIAITGILRFHKDKGIWPASLEELTAAGYIRRVPMDPYSDRPLVYARAQDSFVLYSCGQDFRDNGGIRSPNRSTGEVDLIFWPVETRKK
jgi:hypothetical protein